MQRGSLKGCCFRAPCSSAKNVTFRHEKPVLGAAQARTGPRGARPCRARPLLNLYLGHITYSTINLVLGHIQSMCVSFFRCAVNPLWENTSIDTRAVSESLCNALRLVPVEPSLGSRGWGARKSEARAVLGKLFGPLASLQSRLERTYAPIMPMPATMRLLAWKIYLISIPPPRALIPSA